jgi:PIN domain nuclease of toxin-antitoxin system
LGLVELAITRAHAFRTLGLPALHRDPFDRMLVAQALVEEVPVITNDSRFDGYGVTRIW